MNTLNTSNGESQNRSPARMNEEVEINNPNNPESQAPEMDTTPVKEARPANLDRPTARGEQPLAPLFLQDVADDYRSRWDVVQRSFVDDPRQAVRQGDELVAQVLRNLSESFSKERATLESQLGKADQASTETLRVALRRYRSFFERLLAI